MRRIKQALVGEMIGPLAFVEYLDFYEIWRIIVQIQIKWKLPVEIVYFQTTSGHYEGSK